MPKVIRVTPAPDDTDSKIKTVESEYDIWHGEKQDKKVPMNADDLTWTEASSEFLTNVSMVGARYLAEEESFKFRRFIWLIFILGGMGFMSWQFYDRVSYYVEYPTTTVLKREARDVLDFPVITICNANPFMKTYCWDEASKDILAVLYPSDPYTIWPDYSKVDMPNLTDTQFENWREFMKYVAAKKETMVVTSMFGGCWWLGNAQEPKCSIDSFNDDIVTDYGSSCMQFNAASNETNSTLKATRSGAGWGFSVLLDTQLTWAYTKYTPIEGFRVFIHHKDTVPAMASQAFWVKPGVNAEVAISLVTEKSIGPPHTDCTDGSHKTLKYYDKYTKSRCGRECLTDYIVEQCGCRHYWMPGNVTYCDPKQIQLCVDPNVYRFISKGHIKNCDCRDDCTLHRYRISLSDAPMGTAWSTAMSANAVASGLIPGMSVEELTYHIKSNIVRLEVFFKTMTEEIIETKAAYTMFALFSDLGGALGLILGCTILTIMELIDFLLTTIMKRRYKNKMQKMMDYNK